MKRIVTVMPAIVLALAMSAIAFAQCGGGGCGNCAQGGTAGQTPAMSQAPAGEPDPYRQFMQNTIDLRQAMMNKRFDLQRENLKGTPDVAKIAQLKADIARIQTRIGEIRTQSGLADSGKLDGECGKMGGDCFKMNGECGKMGGGCGEQPCWRK
jgi:ribosomal protein L29